MAKTTKWYERPISNYTRPVAGMFSHGGVKARANYMLTAKGKAKAEEISVSGPKGEVVMALDNSESPSTISELSNATHMSPQKVKQTIQALMRDGWVSKINVE